MALDIIRNKLKPDNPEHYTDLRQVMADIRLMFKNAFLYNPVSQQSIIFNGIKKYHINVLIPKFL